MERRHHVSPCRPGCRGERGASAVEFALLLPILVALLMGIVTSGVSFTHALGITNAVREGARFGATADASQSQWLSDTQTRVRELQFDDPGGQSAVCVQLYKKGTGQVKSGCSQGASLTLAEPATDASAPFTVPAGSCFVRVVAAREFVINVAMVPAWRGTMTRSSVSRYERGTC